MTIEDALRQIAGDLGLDADELIAYATEDTSDGWDYGYGSWIIGSLFGLEGRVLYAIVRALKPKTIVEFGTRQGCSSKHLLAALVANGKGKLISVDPEPMTAIEKFTDEELDRWVVLRESGETAKLPKVVDMVFEDATHEVPLTTSLVSRAISLNPRIVLSHDAEHWVVGEWVREAWGAVGVPFKTLKMDNTDCGFAYWLREWGEH